jgi:uncharacterized protein
MRGWRSWSIGGGFAVAMLLAVQAFWLEPASLRNETQSLRLPGWPAACDGMRVAVLADLHVGSPYNGLDKLDAIVALTQAAHPDLILLAGDYVVQDVIGGHFVPPEEIAPRLGALSAPMGTFAVLGNHDRWFDADRVAHAFGDAHIALLEDRAVPIGHDACALWLAGISDFWTGPHDVGAALRDVPDGATVVAFTHNPDVFPEVPARVKLTIAGHTHGGQVALPLIGRPIVPSRYGQRYAIGHIEEGGRHLFVSSGLGTSILPVRFRVAPEVTVLVVEQGGG